MKIAKQVVVFLLFFLVLALCKFGHSKVDISQTITAMSFKLGQVIVDYK